MGHAATQYLSPLAVRIGAAAVPSLVLLVAAHGIALHQRKLHLYRIRGLDHGSEGTSDVTLAAQLIASGATTQLPAAACGLVTSSLGSRWIGSVSGDETVSERCLKVVGRVH